MMSPKIPDTLFTYKIGSDADDVLKTAARTACNFWNEYIVPKTNIVVRLRSRPMDESTVAEAWEPCAKDGTLYGAIDFNDKHLKLFSPNQVAGTVIHEIGHVLGMGWDEWAKLFEHRTGEFTHRAITACSLLSKMRVELGGGEGTAFSHWDEDVSGAELMTGYQDDVLYVLPVTISVMKLLGHGLRDPLILCLSFGA